MWPSLVACGIAVVGLAVLGAAGPAYRLGAPLASAFAVVRWAAYISLGGAAVSIAALLWSRRKARTGAAVVAGLGVVIGILTAAVGYGWLRQAQGAPPLHDVTTDLENPPSFDALAAQRPSDSNPLTRPGGVDQLQRQHYPDLAPVVVSQPPGLVFDRARLVAENQGWTIVTSDAAAGRLEATDTTRWFGFTDDIVVRLTPWGTGTRVDLRSVSRHGTTDTGTNARRIPALSDSAPSSLATATASMPARRPSSAPDPAGDRQRVPLGSGQATAATIYRAPAPAGRLLVLAHGAGAGQHHPFMTAMAARLSVLGIDVVTFDFDYMHAGRKVPDRAPALETCFGGVIDWATSRDGFSGHRLLIGGKSMGGRMATHLAAAGYVAHGGAGPRLSGVVALGYPLHPPGKPQQLRTAHLPAIRTPLLVVQGSRDTFGTPDELRPVIATIPGPATLHVVDGGDHSFAVARTPREEVLGTVADVIVRWADSSNV